MAGKKTAKKVAPKAAKTSKGFSDEEKAAMRERAKEAKAASRRGANEDSEAEVLAKIAKMADDDRAMAQRIHRIVKDAAPTLISRTWYGMPAYAKDGNVVCFFQDSKKFKTRYSTLGFSDKASLDEGEMWPTSYALRKLTPADEATISALIKKAVG